MQFTRTFFVGLVVLASLLTGCQTPKRKAQESIAAQVYSAPAPAQQAGQGLLAAPIPSAQYAALPVHNGVTVRKVYLEPHVDENGNAYGPQEMWVREEHGWNLDALRTPSKAFIPVQMVEGSRDLSGPSRVTTPAAPGSSQRPDSGSASLREILNLDDVFVTGLVERSQEPMARAMAREQGAHVVPLFDDNLGWLLIPDPTLQPN